MSLAYLPGTVLSPSTSSCGLRARGRHGLLDASGGGLGAAQCLTLHTLLPSHPGNSQAQGDFSSVSQACFSIPVPTSALACHLCLNPKSPCLQPPLPPTHPAQPPHLKALLLTSWPPAADPSMVPSLFHSRSPRPGLNSPESKRFTEPAFPVKEFLRGKERPGVPM